MTSLQNNIKQKIVYADNCTIKKYLLGIILLTSLFSPLIGNIISLANSCENTIDFSIYQQAIYDSFALKNPNPFISTRNVHILQDHFDPVYLLAGPWAALFNNSPYSLLFFEWFFLAATVGFLIYSSQDMRSALLWTFLILWNRGIMHAMDFPIHPTTWSIFPITMTVLAIKEKKEWLFWVSIISLLFFKEIFPIATLFLSAVLLWKKDYKKGIPLISLSISLCLFNFQWRQYLLEGSPLNYTDPIINRWFDNFSIHLVFDAFKHGFKLLLPGTIAIYWIFLRRSFTRADFFITSLWMPIFFNPSCRFSNGPSKWLHHIFTDDIAIVE